MEKLEVKLQLVEILLTASLIGILFYFHYEENKNHKETMDALNGIKNKKV
jgi:hypothetical protein